MKRGLVSFGSSSSILIDAGVFLIDTTTLSTAIFSNGERSATRVPDNSTGTVRRERLRRERGDISTMGQPVNSRAYGANPSQKHIGEISEMPE